MPRRFCKMADRGQIKGAILDGPLAFDNAISKSAAKTKGIVSVAGEADILLAPDLEAGNMIAKQLEYLADARRPGRARRACPIVLTRAPTRCTRIGRARWCADGARQARAPENDDGILVLNAGLSSMEVGSCRCRRRAGRCAPARRRIDDIGGLPHFVAKGAGWALHRGRCRSPAGTTMRRALGDLLAGYGGAHRELPTPRAVGHRSCTAARATAGRCASMPHVRSELERSCRSPAAPAAQPRRHRAIRGLNPQVPQVAFSTPPSTARSRSGTGCSRCRAVPATRACSATVSTACRGYEYVAWPAGGSAARGRAGHRRASRQRALDALRDRGRQKRRVTMGFTAVEGLPMGTHRQPIDPRRAAVPDGRARHGGSSSTDLLYKRSGLLGLSGVSNDIRTLLASGRAGGEACRSITFCYRIARELGSLAAAARRTRCAGVHRRHRRARCAGARTGLRAGGLARHRLRSGGQRRGCGDHDGIEPRDGRGRADRRGRRHRPARNAG